MPTIPPTSLTLHRIPTPIGEALVVSDEVRILRAFDWMDQEAALLSWIRRRYPTAALVEGIGPFLSVFDAYFTGEIDALKDVVWDGGGTDFQRGVWKALCQIPSGETWSYAKLAIAIGRPTASRAVGLANGSNPVALVVPCHRVIGSNGALTGYRGGLHRKLWLLEHEARTLGQNVAFGRNNIARPAVSRARKQLQISD